MSKDNAKPTETNDVRAYLSSTKQDPGALEAKSIIATFDSVSKELYGLGNEIYSPAVSLEQSKIPASQVIGAVSKLSPYSKGTLELRDMMYGLKAETNAGKAALESVQSSAANLVGGVDHLLNVTTDWYNWRVNVTDNQEAQTEASLAAIKTDKVTLANGEEILKSVKYNPDAPKQKS